MKKACFLFLPLFLFPSSIQAQPVAMILTEKAAAYEKVAGEIEAGLGNQVKSYDLRDSHENDKQVAAEVSNQKPSLIIALGDKAALLASARFAGAPVLIGMVLELDVEAFKRQGVEGVALQVPAQSVLTQLKLVLPDFKKIGVLSSGMKFNSFRESIRSSASRLGAEMVDITAPNKAELEKQLAQKLSSLDALWLLPDPNLVDSETFRTIVKKSQESRKPLVVFSENFVKAGAFFSISPDYLATGQQLAILAKKMLAKENVHPEQSYLGKFSYPIGSYSVLNMKTAQAIDLKLSQDQLRFIDRVLNGE